MARNTKPTGKDLPGSRPERKKVADPGRPKMIGRGPGEAVNLGRAR